MKKQKTINRRRFHRVVHHRHRPIPVAVDPDRSRDRNPRIRVLVQSQIRNINPVRLVVSTVNRNHLAMAVVVVQGVPVPVQEIVDRIDRPEHGLEADHHNEAVDIMMDVVARICVFIVFIVDRFLFSASFCWYYMNTRIWEHSNTHSILIL